MTDRILACLRARRFSHTSEAELQDGIAEALEQDGIAFEREVVLTRQCRLDFLVGDDVAIEVKLRCPWAALIIQLYRYVRTGKIRAIVVATCMLQHHRMPKEILGVPVHVVYMGSPV